MLEPFPDEVEVQYGLVNFRTIWALPAGIFLSLAFGGVAPIFLFGKGKWWCTALCAALGMVVAAVFRDDPQTLIAWYGEYNLKDYYD